MGTLAAFLLAIIGPMVGRAIVASGFAAVTLVGVQPSVTQLAGLVVEGLGQAPQSVLQLAGLAGAWEALGLILSAAAWCVTWHLLTGASRYLFRPSA